MGYPRAPHHTCYRVFGYCFPISTFTYMNDPDLVWERFVHPIVLINFISTSFIDALEALLYTYVGLFVKSPIMFECTHSVKYQKTKLWRFNNMGYIVVLDKFHLISCLILSVLKATRRPGECWVAWMPRRQGALFPKASWVCLDA